jgi:enoyl-[acyl-carrier protein] reductase/trans-2-enoyl-CoA reductase (NAD+)
MPIYLALLFKVMKEQGVHEGCIEQIDGLFRDSLYGKEPYLDEEGRLRADRKELDPAIQEAVAALWDQINTDTLRQLSDFAGYKREFLQLFGFEVDGVDYDAEVSPVAVIENLA